MNRRQNKSVVTANAYLLFYRRVSTVPLGGPFFEQLMSAAENDTPSASQPNSRAPSPSAGEGQRLDDSSRNGSSSALRGVGAAHQAGGGGQVELATPRQTTMTEDNDLPPYSTVDPQNMETETLEHMDFEEDEGIGMDDTDRTRLRGGTTFDPYSHVQHDRPAWSFSELNDDNPIDMDASILHLPPPNSDVDVDDEDSVKAGSANSDPDLRMADFGDDEGSTEDSFGTPPRDMNSGTQRPWEPMRFIRENEEGKGTAEVGVDSPKEEHDAKMD